MSSEAVKKNLSANVQKLRFMQVAANASRKAELARMMDQPEWVVDEAEFAKIDKAEVPGGYNESHSIERIKLTCQHRKSFKNFNPVVEGFQKQIASRAARFRHEKDLDNGIQRV